MTEVVEPQTNGVQDDDCHKIRPADIEAVSESFYFDNNVQG
jgi:hypothetical protein